MSCRLRIATTAFSFNQREPEVTGGNSPAGPVPTSSYRHKVEDIAGQPEFSALASRKPRWVTRLVPLPGCWEMGTNRIVRRVPLFCRRCAAPSTAS